ncbi:response regulator transcription factor [Streptomyces sp. V1I6]|uniref:LuxR C-terminal-related transcriptional regulator n=1 Tax=Streptomyces sp. V1I6 TaxID=3042273 RepID=UPI00277FD464|nr:response regulator transcription factor [Streptomyces sp. V1I6]MDQ0847396.1 DNA-binding NarL/FixJ family response regulator [Streptomyces sp. V1I6]
MDADPRRVVVVGDCPLIRLGIVQLITGEPDLLLVAAVSSVEELDALPVDAGMVVLNIRLDTLELARTVSRLCARGYATVVISATAHIDLAPAIRAGARGCLDSQAEQAELLLAVRAVVAGETYVPGPLAVHLLLEPLHLTDREREILGRVASGDTDREIAVLLGISEHTVHSHLDRLRDKIGARRRADLTRFAIEYSLVPPTPGRGRSTHPARGD